MYRPEEVLHSFIAEMHQWEINCCLSSKKVNAGQVEESAHNNNCENTYQRIYGKYCSPTKGTPRNFHYLNPPEYSPDWETIQNVTIRSSTLVNLETLKVYPPEYKTSDEHFVYHLILEGGDWKLYDKVEITAEGKKRRLGL